MNNVVLLHADGTVSYYSINNTCWKTRNGQYIAEIAFTTVILSVLLGITLFEINNLFGHEHTIFL